MINRSTPRRLRESAASPVPSITRPGQPLFRNGMAGNRGSSKGRRKGHSFTETVARAPQAAETPLWCRGRDGPRGTGSRTRWAVDCDPGNAGLRSMGKRTISAILDLSIDRKDEPDGNDLPRDSAALCLARTAHEPPNGTVNEQAREGIWAILMRARLRRIVESTHSSSTRRKRSRSLTIGFSFLYFSPEASKNFRYLPADTLEPRPTGLHRLLSVTDYETAT